jgi:Na+/H+ antiporter NhaD/arsenite permease-like protein
MTELIVAVFAATYLGMAAGRIPGLKIDRTGIALLALAILLATGAADFAALGNAIDASTLVLLFALMILSAQFSLSGFYDSCAARIVRAETSPRGLLALTVAAGGGLSAVLANDIIVFAMTPLLCRGLAGRGLDPRPYLLALAAASNAGSAATLIGNPQNILIGQVGGLDFWAYSAIAGVPALLALAVVYVVVAFVWRDALVRPPAAAAGLENPELDRWQAVKGVVLTVALIALFTTPFPRVTGALAIAAALLVSRRMASRRMIAAVDWHLLVLFACLFTVTHAFAGTGVAQDALAALNRAGLWPDRLVVLAPLTLLASNLIGNVPAVMLLLAVWPDAAAGSLHALALLSTLAGNLLLVGSLANLIVVERAAAAGVTLGFRDFARTGIPIALLSMAIAAAWLGAFAIMPWH